MRPDFDDDLDDEPRPRRPSRCYDGMCGAMDCERCHPHPDDEEEEEP